MTLADVEVDGPFNYDNGRPVSNWYSSGYRGICSLRDGIRDSLNIVTVKVLTQITPRLGYEYLQKFGFTTLVDGVEKNGKIFSDVQQALALGGITYGVKNIELNASYATIANGGQYIRPKLYTIVKDHDGNVILDNTRHRGYAGHQTLHRIPLNERNAGCCHLRYRYCCQLRRHVHRR